MDRPRFQRVEGAGDQVHRRYHGGGLVEAVFALVDAWQQARRSPSLQHDDRSSSVAGTLAVLSGDRDSPA